MTIMRTLCHLAVVSVLAGAGSAMAQPQGVTDQEILIGTLQDLSGPLAGYGKDLRNGMLMRVAEANEAGGVHGRQLKLLVEDTGYDPRRAVLGAQKLVNQDKIFVMAGSLGTAVNNAAMPVMMSKNVMSFFPAALSRDMYEPVHKLKFSFLSSYYDQIAPTAARLYQEKTPPRLALFIRTTNTASRSCEAPRRGSRASARSCARKPASSAAPPISRRRWRG